MSTRKSKKRSRETDKDWQSVSTSLHKDPMEDYHIEIEWLKSNMCRITTKLYGDHNQPVPACHQSAHYIYLGVSIFKMLRGNPNFTSISASRQKRIFEKLLSHAIYQNQRYLFLLADSDFQRSHRWFYVCPEELTGESHHNGDYLLLCITSRNGNAIEDCVKRKMNGWMNEDSYPSEIGTGHYGFLSLHNGKVEMTSSWVAVSSAESRRHIEYETMISRQVNSHSTTLAKFKKYAQIIAMPLEARDKEDQKTVSDAYDFIGAISRYDPLLKEYVKRALLRRDREAFAEYMNPLIIVLIKIENLPVEFQDSQGEDYNIEDVLLSRSRSRSSSNSRSPKKARSKKRTAKRSYRNYTDQK